MTVFKSFLGAIGAGRRPTMATGTAATDSQPSGSTNPLLQQNRARRDLVRLALKDTLNRAGIPTSWIGIDLLTATSRGREPGIHARLLIKHTDPRLMLHAVAIEGSLRKRVTGLDPDSPSWFMGMSWQFPVQAEDAVPALPHPGSWTTTNVGVESASQQPEDPRADARADLERLMAVRDEAMKRASGAPADAFAVTEPARLPFAATEPAGLGALREPGDSAAPSPLLQNSMTGTESGPVRIRRPKA